MQHSHKRYKHANKAKQQKKVPYIYDNFPNTQSKNNKNTKQ